MPNGRKTWAITLECVTVSKSHGYTYTKMSNGEANNYDELKKALLTKYNFSEGGYRRRLRDVKTEIDEMPDQITT